MKLLAFLVLCVVPCLAQLDYTLRPGDRIYSIGDNRLKSILGDDATTTNGSDLP